MEKIIFFGLVIPIMAYVLYLGAMAIMNGFNAKEANKADINEVDSEDSSQLSDDSSTLSNELTKLNDLQEKGVITKEEFEKAKYKLLNN